MRYFTAAAAEHIYHFIILIQVIVRIIKYNNNTRVLVIFWFKMLSLCKSIKNMLFHDSAHWTDQSEFLVKGKFILFYFPT